MKKYTTAQRLQISFICQQIVSHCKAVSEKHKQGTNCPPPVTPIKILSLATLEKTINEQLKNKA